jgi:hypothetical protein
MSLVANAILGQRQRIGLDHLVNAQKDKYGLIASSQRFSSGQERLSSSSSFFQ